MFEYAVAKLGSNDKLLEDFAAVRQSLSSPKYQAMLDVAIEHTRARLIDKDIDRAMAAMTSNPVCRFFGTAGIPDYLGDISVRMLYRKSIEAEGNAESLKLDRVTVGDSSVVIEGRISYSMGLFAKLFPEPAKAISTDRAAVMQKRVCIVLPFEDMKIAGETRYFDGVFTAEDIAYLDDQSFDAGLLSRCPFGFLFKGH